MSYTDFTLDKKMVLHYVVPFYFESSDLKSTEGYESITQALSQSQCWTEETLGTAERNIDPYILSSVFPSENAPHIGRSWNYDFRNKYPHLRYTADRKAPLYHYWTIKTAGLYVFKSGIGFLWYSLIPSANEKVLMNAEELIRFQYDFKELCRSNRNFELQRYIPRTHEGGEDGYESFHTGRWVRSMLENIIDRIHFQNSCLIKEDADSSVKCEAPNTAILFHYLLMDSPDADRADDELRRISYLLSNAQATSYLIPEDFAAPMVTPFDGTCWYASKSGCGYYALRRKENRAFFASDLPDRIRSDYFLLYILVLHQSFSLSNYLRRISMELPAEAEEYTVPSDAGVRLDKLVAEINTFLMKSMYFSVSPVHHLNVFFEHLQKRLRIHEDIEGINEGTNAVVKLQRIRKEYEELRLAKEEQRQQELRDKQEAELRRQEQEERELQQQREEDNDRSLNNTMGLLSLFAIFSAFNDFTQIWTEFQKLPWSDLNFLSLRAWKMVGVYLYNGAPQTIFLAICYLIIFVLSVFCVCSVLKTALRHKSRKKRKNR